MKKIVAVSGGVDSVVLLDMLAREDSADIIVAHFDHGIRADSAHDAEFVKKLAEKYNVTFETTREELGKNASEKHARERRYAHLRLLAKQHTANIYTAHHLDDLVESIAINFYRGTGWRGLTVLHASDITRPLLQYTKQQLYEYALDHNIEYVEDETNSDRKYLRNALRQKTMMLTIGAKKELAERRQQQLQYANAIAHEANRLLVHAKGSRYFFSMIDEDNAVELLQTMVANANASLTRPQLRRAIHAIKTACTGSTFEAGGGVKLIFEQRSFVVKQES